MRITVTYHFQQIHFPHGFLVQKFVLTLAFQELEAIHGGGKGISNLILILLSTVT